MLARQKRTTGIGGKVVGQKCSNSGAHEGKGIYWGGGGVRENGIKLLGMRSKGGPLTNKKSFL